LARARRRARRAHRRHGAQVGLHLRQVLRLLHLGRCVHALVPQLDVRARLRADDPRARARPRRRGAAAAVVWEFGSARHSQQLIVLANIAFLLNAFNLLPVGFLDGGQAVRAAHEAWRMPRIQFAEGVPVAAFAPDRTRALAIWFIYFALAALLVAGMLATRPSGG